jgi:hypothetical protein
MSDETSQDNRIYAGLVIRDMVNPLEAANNLAYLLSVSTSDASTVAHYVEMLQSQLARINEIVQRTLDDARRPAGN